MPRAFLGGNRRTPGVWLLFDRDERHAVTGVPLQDWVQNAPRRRWEPATGCWVVEAFGDKDPEELLRRAGFEIDYTSGPPGSGGVDHTLADVVSLMELYRPLVKQSDVAPATALVRPRFRGWHGTRDLLGDAAVWDKTRGRFEAPLTDILLHGNLKKGLETDKATLEAARAALLRTVDHENADVAAEAARAASSVGLESFDKLTEIVGDIPDWFGMDPFPYQRVGAQAIAAGRTFLADPPGLGKTVQTIAACAIRDSKRVVLVVPPVVVTHWAREIERCHLAVPLPPPPKKRPAAKKTAAKKGQAGAPRQVEAPAPLGPDPDGSPLAPPSHEPPSQAGLTIVPSPTGDGQGNFDDQPDLFAHFPPGAPRGRFIAVFQAGKKEPELPESGIAIVPDSLLASRPALVNTLAMWRPDALAYDEAHRARTWKSKRASAVRDLVARLDPSAMRITSTATPLFSNPAELASLLAISGHLDPVFGGYGAFTSRYCKRDHFNALVADTKMLPELRKIMAERVWIRRNKEEVLTDLPSKMRVAQFLNVDLDGFRAAHGEVIEKILVWLDAFTAEKGRYPDDEEIEAYAKSQIGLMSPLRTAAGVAKVPFVVEMLEEWVANEVTINLDGSFVCDRPLVVWVHHKPVGLALVEALGKLKQSARHPLTAVIDGSTPIDKRGEIVDRFQAGQIPILICSITAAGVGITLTKSSDAWFVETDYSVPNVAQAEDRLHRIGQENHVTITTMIAEGTLDGRIQKILKAKAKVIDAVVGGASSDVSTLTDEQVGDTEAPFEIISELVVGAIEKHRRLRKAA